VKSGDPQKAEQALSAAETAAKEVQNQTSNSSNLKPGVDTYA
jgi:hypothetical protein